MLLLDWIEEENDSEYGALSTLYELFVAMDVPSELAIVVSKRVVEKLGTSMQIQLTSNVKPQWAC
ncbi:hypothetical protein DPMN_023822 [Dreissena polymorpha]|uniref:Uncharacterized protein n=1 Tax=Dreissena polymorpha TaxID=45954 RepID=A0A9D4LN77_DREPO|nr:hypothetical protein DPMN_023822 [Dreissena polymorpha]